MGHPIPKAVDESGLRLHRIIASRFPPIDVFEDAASYDEFEVLYRLESITNGRISDEGSPIARINPAHCIFGIGSTPVMAAFAYCSQYGRFNTPERGAYYASTSTDGALAEHSYHWLANIIRDASLAESIEPITEVREYRNNLVLPVHDIRNTKTFDFVYHDTDYTESQRFANMLRDDEASHGVIYQSMRSANDLCVAAFQPNTVSNCVQGSHFRYTYLNGDVQIAAA